jgi:hypothetical protein
MSSEMTNDTPIPIGKLAYFRGRLSERIHEAVLDVFARLEEQQKITRAALARRIGRKPEQITRWLGVSGNLESDTVSDLLLGMGYELGVSVLSIEAKAELPSEQQAIQRRASNDKAFDVIENLGLSHKRVNNKPEPQAQSA